MRRESRDRESHAILVRLLGHGEVRVDDRIVEAFVAPRLQSLLGFLIVHRREALSRQRLAFLLWPDSSEPQARTNLRQALHIVRHALPNAHRVLRSDGPTVQWLAAGPAVVDLVEFENACERAEVSKRREDLEQAVAAYRGDLLPGCYDEWVAPERQRLRRRYADVLDRLTRWNEDSGDLAAAISSAEQLVTLDPLDEANSRRLMRLLARTGQRARALRVYHECVSTLADELGVLPSGETVDEYERLVTEPQQRLQTVEGRVPVVGRESQWRTLVERWESSMAGRAQLVVVRGEPGIGKSRLVEEFRSCCARLGVTTASSRAYEAEGPLSYAPVIEILRSPGVRPSLASLDRVWLVELARLLPELADEHPGLVEMAAQPSGDRTRLFEGAARAIIAHPEPLLIVIDDLQWCDADTLEFVHFFLRFARTSRVLVLGTARDEDVGSDHPLRKVTGSLATIDAVADVPLGRLDRAAATMLAEQLTGGAQVAVVDRLVRLAEGHPLFLVELARSSTTVGSADEEDTLAAAVPPRVHTVIEARLAKLSPDARQLVAAAAVVGHGCSIDLLVRLATGRSDDDVVAAVDELWSRGVFRERGDDGYDFTHDLIREVAYAVIGPATRRRLHLHLGRALEELNAGALEEVAGEIATNFDRAGLVDDAIRYYSRAVEVARHSFADDNVVGLCRRALELVARKTPGTDRDDLELGFLVPLGVALYSSGVLHHVDDRWVYERAAALRTARGLPPEPSTLRVMGNYAIAHRDFVSAQAHGRTLLAVAEHSADPLLLTEAHYLLGVSSFWRGELAASDHHLRRAVEWYDAERAGAHVELFGQDPKAVCLVRLAWTSWHLGGTGEVVRLSDEALALARSLGHAYTEAYVRVFGALVAIDSGSFARAATLVDRVVDADWGRTWIPHMRNIILGRADLELGDPVAGTRQIETALAKLASTGQTLLEPLALMYLARGHAAVGDTPAAVDAAREAFVVTGREMQVYEPEAARLLGESLGSNGADPDDVEHALRHAVLTSAARGAVMQELHARTSLVRWLRAGHRPAARTEERALAALRRRLGASTGGVAGHRS